MKAPPFPGVPRHFEGQQEWGCESEVGVGERVGPIAHDGGLDPVRQFLIAQHPHEVMGCTSRAGHAEIDQLSRLKLEKVVRCRIYHTLGAGLDSQPQESGGDVVRRTEAEQPHGRTEDVPVDRVAVPVLGSLNDESQYDVSRRAVCGHDGCHGSQVNRFDGDRRHNSTSIMSRISVVNII